MVNTSEVVIKIDVKYTNHVFNIGKPVQTIETILFEDLLEVGNTSEAVIKIDGEAYEPRFQYRQTRSNH